MTIYDNEPIKIYTGLNLTAPSKQEVNSQNYRLAEISEVEASFLDEIAKTE